MTHDLNRFDWIADRYDALAQFIFGQAINDSQLSFLGDIAPDARILVVGGGTGNMLEPLLTVNGTCEICYVEASARMISIAREKIDPSLMTRVHFLHGTHQTLSAGRKFDVIITNFFLDMYPSERLAEICNGLYPKLKEEGVWFVADFIQTGKFWHQLLLWLMYRFFSLTDSIEAVKLPAWERLLSNTGLSEIKSVLFYKGFIKSAVFQKRLAN
jgi:ubiquinone/menaquinone biosynthesis C-methylase UbiE